MTLWFITRDEMGAIERSVVVDYVRTKVVEFSGAAKPAEQSAPGTWRHNELSPSSRMVSTGRRFSTQKAPSGHNPGGGSHASCVRPLRPAGCS